METRRQRRNHGIKSPAPFLEFVMKLIRHLLATANDPILSVLRLSLGVIFIAHGTQKVLGLFGGPGLSGTMTYFTRVMHIPAPFAFAAIIAEFVGGITLILGLASRVAALAI